MARRRSRQATEAALLDSTAELVAAVGVNGFTLSDVAKRAGVNRALIYHYFDDRPTLIARATERVVERSMQQRASSGLLPLEQVMAAFIQYPLLPRVFLRFLIGSDPWPQPIRDRFRFVAEQAEQARQRAGASFDAEMAVAVATVAGMTWTCAREGYAAFLGISTEEADRRFLAALAGSALQELEELQA